MDMRSLESEKGCIGLVLEYGDLPRLAHQRALKGRLRASVATEYSGVARMHGDSARTDGH